ncbi:hypothetical protein LCGC14_1101450 [marine sediment metagenome]|uniref:Uncharacterized protein n=1 Tax=marine sediment metagenome TaxID=412755 RepID=A0A0F9MDW3_9ZZZZ
MGKSNVVPKEPKNTIPSISLSKQGSVPKGKGDIITKNSLSKKGFSGGQSPAHPEGY